MCVKNPEAKCTENLDKHSIKAYAKSGNSQLIEKMNSHIELIK